MFATSLDVLSCLFAVQVRFVIGESFYRVGPEEAEEDLQEGMHIMRIHNLQSYFTQCFLLFQSYSMTRLVCELQPQPGYSKKSQT